MVMMNQLLAGAWQEQLTECGKVRLPASVHCLEFRYIWHPLCFHNVPQSWTSAVHLQVSPWSKPYFISTWKQVTVVDCLKVLKTEAPQAYGRGSLCINLHRTELQKMFVQVRVKATLLGFLMLCSFKGHAGPSKAPFDFGISMALLVFCLLLQQ